MESNRIESTNEHLEFALDLVMEVGRNLLDYFRDDGRVRSTNKVDGSLLTEADLAANELILDGIGSRFEDHGILTEEGMTVAPESTYVWIIDPLDGTTNFTWRIPIWSVSIALARQGTLEVGVIAFPALGRTYHALRGGGAFLNDHRFETVPLSKREDNQIFVTCTNTLKNYTLEIPYKVRVLGSASYNLVMVAEGDAVGGMEQRPKIWDAAAGHLIIEEAGGIVGHPFSPPFFPFTPKSDYADISRPMITANCPETYESLLKWIKPRG